MALKRYGFTRRAIPRERKDFEGGRMREEGGKKREKEKGERIKVKG